MIYSNIGSFGKWSSVANFLMRRVIRIVPLYWIVATIFLMTLQIVGENPGLSPPYIAASYFFIPYPEPQDGADFPFYFLAWTLEFEMFFYFCFAIALIWRRSVGVPGLCVFMVAYLTVGSLWTFPAPLDYWGQFAASGVRCGMSAGRGLLARRALAGSGMPDVDRCGDRGGARGVVFPRRLAGSSRACLGLARHGAGRRRYAASPPRATGRLETLLAPVGDASYSLYLVHSLVLHHRLPYASARVSPLAKHPAGSLHRIVADHGVPDGLHQLHLHRTSADRIAPTPTSAPLHWSMMSKRQRRLLHDIMLDLTENVISP